MHYVEFPWILPTKKFVEEVIMQIALIGCENSEARCERLRDLLRERGGRALSDCARKHELTRPWAIYQLNLDFSEKISPNFKNCF